MPASALSPECWAQCGTRAPGCDWPARGRGVDRVCAGARRRRARRRRSAQSARGRREAAGAPRPARGASPGVGPTARPLPAPSPLPAPPGPRHGERALRGEALPQLPAAAARASLDRGLSGRGARARAGTVSRPGASPPLPSPGASPPGPSRRGPAVWRPRPWKGFPPSPRGNFRTRPSGRPFKFPTLATCRWSEGKRPFSACPWERILPVMRSTCLRTASLFSILLLLCDKGDEFVGMWGRKTEGSQHRRLGKQDGVKSSLICNVFMLQHTWTRWGKMVNSKMYSSVMPEIPFEFDYEGRWIVATCLQFNAVATGNGK